MSHLIRTMSFLLKVFIFLFNLIKCHIGLTIKMSFKKIESNKINMSFQKWRLNLIKLAKMYEAIKLDNLKNHAFVAMWSPSKANLWDILYSKDKFSCDVFKTSTTWKCHAPSCHCSYSMSWIFDDIIITQVYHLIILVDLLFKWLD
jgi:hypothetical protein